ncbi:MAG TPA: hypothetical protein PKB15_08410 [Acidimicrobiia bacterium]|jgi:hypothetical protein|nr:hypothetical protein [Acidimicrobiia bacterium]
MARGLKYPGTLRSHAVTTSSYWAHLSRNPLVFQSSDRPSFPLDDIQLVSVGSHLPLEMTGALLTGNVCGDVWSMGPSDVELMKAFMEGIDGSDRIIDLASDLRESYGTHGDKVSVADRTPLIIVQDVKEFTDFFRPLTSLYRYVPVQPASKRVELTLPGL